MRSRGQAKIALRRDYMPLALGELVLPRRARGWPCLREALFPPGGCSTRCVLTVTALERARLRCHKFQTHPHRVVANKWASFQPLKCVVISYAAKNRHTPSISDCERGFLYRNSKPQQGHEVGAEKTAVCVNVAITGYTGFRGGSSSGTGFVSVLPRSCDPD